MGGECPFLPPTSILSRIVLVSRMRWGSKVATRIPDVGIRDVGLQAHPALVSLAKSVFDEYMPAPNQIVRSPALSGKDVTEADLLKLRVVPKGEAITSGGLQKG